MAEREAMIEAERRSIEGLQAALMLAARRVLNTRKQLRETLQGLPPGEPIVVDGEAIGESACSWARSAFVDDLDSLEEIADGFLRDATRDRKLWRQWAIDSWRQDQRFDEKRRQKAVPSVSTSDNRGSDDSERRERVERAARGVLRALNLRESPEVLKLAAEAITTFGYYLEARLEGAAARQ